MGVDVIDTSASSVTTASEREVAASGLATSQQKNATNTGLVRNTDSVNAANNSAILNRKHSYIAHQSNGKNYIGGSNRHNNLNSNNGLGGYDPVQQLAHAGAGRGDAGGDAIAHGYDMGKNTVQGVVGAKRAIKGGINTVRDIQKLNKGQAQIKKTYGSTGELARGSDMRKQYHLKKTKMTAKGAGKAGVTGGKRVGSAVLDKIEEEDDFVKYNSKAMRKGAKYAGKLGKKGVKKGYRISKKGVKKIGKKIADKRAAATAKRAAQASKHTAQWGAKATKAGAKATAKGAQVVGKGVAAAGKGIAAGVKGIGAAIAAGGWIPLVVFFAIVLIVLLLILISTFFAAERQGIGKLTGNEAIIAQVLLDRGFDNSHVAGILGNLYAESGCNPAVIEGGEVAEDLDQSRWTEYCGYGIAQWTSSSVGGRKWNVCEYSKTKAGKTSDCQCQSEYLADELQNKRGKVWLTHLSSYYGHECMELDQWMTLTDIAEITRQYCICMERPSDSAYAGSIDKRISKAQEYYALMCEEGGGGGNDAVSRAYAEIGKPYGWGKAGPDAYDCSGLVSYCISGKHMHCGTARDFANWPQTKSPSPGDICTSGSHCGIYIGNDQMIHAPNFGQTVCIGPVQDHMIYVTNPYK